MATLTFEVRAQDGHARHAELKTRHALVKTPAFMPVGTQATVKSQTPEEVAASGARMVLANTYHLWLRPGAERVARLGGIHRFMGWPYGVLTDSGGYQVYSLAKLRAIDDEGVVFQSHLDGTRLQLTPEESLNIQGLLGSDIAMVLDECPPAQAARDAIVEAMRRTTLWAQRSLAVPPVDGQARFGIVQGGIHSDLRQAHLNEICALAFDGFALGGFSVGEPPALMHQLVDELAPMMPADKPRYLMGVGAPEDLLRAIAAGVDLFDCVLPTRNGRNGQAFTHHGRVNIRQARHQDDQSPLDEDCMCYVCTTHSRAYLRHLFHANEMLGPRLLTQHNLHFYATLMADARAAIIARRFAGYMTKTLEKLREGDEIADDRA